jgi:hypothetical protein
MTTPTLPAKLVAHLLAGVLEQARARAERLLDRNPRRRQAVHDRTAGRSLEDRMAELILGTGDTNL